MINHKTVSVSSGDLVADIDEKIAPLIKRLWDLGLQTSNSCEDNVPQGWVWIEFDSCSDAQRFLNLVADYSEDRNSLYNRIRQGWDSDDDELFWKYDVIPNDLGVAMDLVVDEDGDESIDETFLGKSDFIFSVSIRFPQTDLEQVMKSLNK
jgi:hypothetical protein